MSVPASAKAMIQHLFTVIAVLAALVTAAGPAAAQTGQFDLVGPTLRVSVRHAGVTLPLSQVPNLTAGDRIRVAVDLPPEQGAHYLMVLAFLRGATNPPPKDWLTQAETWKPKKAIIDTVVPKGAEQALVFLVPDTGGAIGAVTAAVRDRPGAFVRASQELNQAMLDRARLAAFLDGIHRYDATRIAEVSPQLAQSLAVKLDTNCLLRQADTQAACLTQSSNAVVLADSQTSSIAETLAGAPVDLALQLSATPQGGYGYYSPYIGVVRDLARIFGAFQSAQLQFIPALSEQRSGATDLLLNAVPSFRRPQSVLVVALPPVSAPKLPPLQPATNAALCLYRPGVVLPVSGAPLVFATDYPRGMALRVRKAGGASIDLPVAVDAAKGGYVLAGSAPPDVDTAAPGVLHGIWGFTPFDGPAFALGDKAACTEKVAPPRPQASLVAKSVERAVSPGPMPLRMEGTDLIAQDARLTFSLRTAGRFLPGDTVEIAAADDRLTTTVPLRLQDAQVAVATVAPGTALGPSAYGPLRFRLKRGDATGEWQKLATLVRLPTLGGFACDPVRCTVSGSNLFLIRDVGTGGPERTAVPDGFTGTTIDLPPVATPPTSLSLALRDDPDARAVATLSP